MSPSRIVRCASLMVLAVLPTPAEQPSAPPMKVPGVEQVTVRLAQFDVVVRDSSRKFVSGLGPADFKVLEDGAPLEIVAVDEWGSESAPQTRTSTGPSIPHPPSQPLAPSAPPPEAAASEPERRSFVFVFDALGESTALRMNQAKRAAVEFVRTRFKSNDVGAVYQLDLSLRALSGISSERDTLVKGIESVTWMPASSLADQINESVLAYEGQTNQSVALSRLQQQSANVAGQLDWQREHIYQSLTDLAAIFQGMPGKRTLVLASPGFPMTTNADTRLQSGGFTPKFQKLIKAMATYGVTVYSIDLGSELTAGDASQMIDWRVAVGKLGMDENVLDGLGLERTLGTNSATSRRQFLGVVAAETGGRMLTDTNLARSFTTIDEESSHFYRISCRVPVTSAANRYRSFKVSVSRDRCTVSTRRGRYSDVIPFEREATATGKPVAIDAVASYKQLNTRGTAFPLPMSPSGKIPVVVVLEALGPVDVPLSAAGTGSIDLDLLIVARVADEVVARYERGITATLKKGSEAVRAGFRVEGRLELPPGIYEVQGTARLASPAQIASWTGSVAVTPQSKGSAPAIIGPMLILEGDSAIPLLIQPPAPEGKDPLGVTSGARFLPATSSEIAAGQPILAMFWMKGFVIPDGSSPAVEFNVALIGANGEPIAAPSQLLYYGPSADGATSAIVRLDTAPLAAATYLIQVSATPPGSTAPITRRTAPFSLRPRPNAPAAATSSSSAP